RQAVESFGPAPLVANKARAARRIGPAAAAGVAAWSGIALAGIGLVAVGVSGVLAELFNLVAGQRFVGDPPQTYSAGSCHHFLALHPAAANCAAAAMFENSHDAVALRV